VNAVDTLMELGRYGDPHATSQKQNRGASDIN
jgi:hypothetical protein